MEWRLCPTPFHPGTSSCSPGFRSSPCSAQSPFAGEGESATRQTDVKMVGDIHPCILAGECFSHRLDVGPLPLSDSLCSPSGTSPDSLSGLGVLQSPIPSRGLSHSPVSAHGVSCSSSSSPSFPVCLRSRSASPLLSSPACTRRSLVFSPALSPVSARSLSVQTVASGASAAPPSGFRHGVAFQRVPIRQHRHDRFPCSAYGPQREIEVALAPVAFTHSSW